MNFRSEMEVLKAQFFNRELTLGELKNKAKPLIEQFNKKSAGIAKKHGVKPKRFSLAGFLR